MILGTSHSLSHQPSGSVVAQNPLTALRLEERRSSSQASSDCRGRGVLSLSHELEKEAGGKTGLNLYPGRVMRVLLAHLPRGAMY